jgi:hypothetical protein
VLNGKLKINKKYYFDFSMLVLHALKGMQNKMSKYLFSSKNIISTYLLKKAKTNKVRLTKI